MPNATGVAAALGVELGGRDVVVDDMVKVPLLARVEDEGGLVVGGAVVWPVVGAEVTEVEPEPVVVVLALLLPVGVAPPRVRLYWEQSAWPLAAALPTSSAEQPVEGLSRQGATARGSRPHWHPTSLGAQPLAEMAAARHEVAQGGMPEKFWATTTLAAAARMRVAFILSGGIIAGRGTTEESGLQVVGWQEQRLEV